MFEDFRLNVFVAVAREGSFTKAAAALGVSQPAVSQNVADLEKSLGVKLFERLRGEVVLTPEGEVFMKYARNILDSCSKAESMFTDLQPRTIRVAASEEIYEYVIINISNPVSQIYKSSCKEYNSYKCNCQSLKLVDMLRF